MGRGDILTRERDGKEYSLKGFKGCSCDVQAGRLWVQDQEGWRLLDLRKSYLIRFQTEIGFVTIDVHGIKQ